MGLSTKHMVLSMGVEKSRSYKLFSERQITIVFHLGSERGREFCKDSVSRKLAFWKHCILLLFWELFCHEIPFQYPGA